MELYPWWRDYLERHVVKFHPLMGWLITPNPTQFLCRPRVPPSCWPSWELAAIGDLYPPSSLAFYFYILHCDYWERSLVVLVFLMVEVFTTRVDIGFSSWLEGCACLEPATEQSKLRPAVYLHLVELIFLFFLRNGDSKSSRPSLRCQYNLGCPFLLSFNSKL